jgi:type I restriction enzyme S subunit
MGLVKLGKYIEPSDLRNSGGTYDETAVVGLSTAKQIITTKADLDGVSLTSYKLLPPYHFAYVPDTSRRGDKMSLGYNTTEQTFLVSSISVVFRVSDTVNLNSDYLYIYFNRPEFDRYARFNSWGSAREAFSWDDMCDIEINLPPLPIQQKYVDVSNAMLANQLTYESGLEDLKLTCDAYIERLGREMPQTAIGEFIRQSDERNGIGLGVESVRGLAVSKAMIETKADINGVSLGNYKVLPPKHIAYVPDTSRRGDKISLGFNGSDETYLVSSISTVFGTDKERLLPEYLMLFFTRSEFDRYTRFHSWGSARETFGWDDMCEVKIPIPDTGVQQSIVNIYNAYLMRREINEKLKAQIKDICPILIKGSLEEASA